MKEKTQIKNKNWSWKKIGKILLFIILGLWLVISAGYIVHERVVRFINQQILIAYQLAYQQGVSDTVRALIGEAELCRPVSLIDGERRIEVIKIGCPVE
jgi:hypothetical protein